MIIKKIATSIRYNNSFKHTQLLKKKTTIYQGITKWHIQFVKCVLRVIFILTEFCVNEEWKENNK